MDSPVTIGTAVARKKSTADAIEIPEAMRVHIGRLFGPQSRYARKTHLSDAEWRSLLKALLIELDRYRRVNVNTDGLHSLFLDTGLASADHSLNADVFWPGYIEGILRFALLLMGDYPDHRGRKRGRKSLEHYELTLLRSPAFTQTSSQRFRTLYMAVDLGICGTKKKMWQLLSPFYDEFGYRRTNRETLEWFRRTYPDIYSRVF